MTTFYLCRHGETENNKKRLLSGWIDTPLTDQGIANASVAARKLSGIKLDKIISSDLGRALTTASLIAKDIGYSGEIETFPQLREINYGKFANVAIAHYPKMLALENADFIPEGGESLNQMAKRVMDFVEEYAEANPEKSILLVAHDGTIKAVYASFLKENIGLVDARLEIAHDIINKVVYSNGSISEFQEIG